METGQTVRESALHAGRQAWWPLDAMACSLGDTTTSGGGGFLLGWDPQLSYFGLGAWGAGTGDLDSYQRELELVVPKCKSNSLCTSTWPAACISFSFPFPAALVSMALTRLPSGMCALGMESPVSEASTAAVTGLPTPQNATAMPVELDELLQVSGRLKASPPMKEDSHATLVVGLCCLLFYLSELLLCRQSLWGSDEEEIAVGFTSGSPLKEASAVSSQCRDSEAGLLAGLNS